MTWLMLKFDEKILREKKIWLKLMINKLNNCDFFCEPNITAAHCVEFCSGQEVHSPAPRNISCVFKGRGDQWIPLAGLLDSGNLIPGLAAISTEFADKIGVRLEPY